MVLIEQMDILMLLVFNLVKKTIIFDLISEVRLENIDSVYALIDPPFRGKSSDCVCEKVCFVFRSW